MLRRGTKLNMAGRALLRMCADRTVRLSNVRGNNSARQKSCFVRRISLFNWIGFGSGLPTYLVVSTFAPWPRSELTLADGSNSIRPTSGGTLECCLNILLSMEH